jgi:hypothetical protein
MVIGSRRCFGNSERQKRFARAAARARGKRHGTPLLAARAKKAMAITAQGAHAALGVSAGAGVLAKGRRA